MPRKLKVYRTPIGFHDAYVAAPSRKAALEAWGTQTNLFASAAAEEVTLPALMEEALAHPGTVIRKPRGSMAEHLAALPPEPERAARKADSATPPPAPPAKPGRSKPKPRPARDELDAAETALEDAEKHHAAAKRAFAEREAALARERRQMERDQDRALAALEKARTRAQAAYDKALDAWRKDRP